MTNKKLYGSKHITPPKYSNFLPSAPDIYPTAYFSCFISFSKLIGVTQVFIYLYICSFPRVTYVNKWHTTQPVVQAKNPDAIFDFTLSHTLHQIYHVLLVLPTKYFLNIFILLFLYCHHYSPLSLTWTTEIL